MPEPQDVRLHLPDGRSVRPIASSHHLPRAGETTERWMYSFGDVLPHDPVSPEANLLTVSIHQRPDGGDGDSGNSSSP